MPSVDSERVRLLCSWAKTHFTSGRILDVGSVGADDPFLLREIQKKLAPDCKLVASDINIQGLGKIDKDGNLHVVVANLYRLPFPDETFHGCIFAEVLEHLYDAIDALSELARVMKQGGVILLSTPNPFAGARAWRYWYSHPQPWDKQNLALSVGNHLDEQRVEGAAHIQFYDPLSLCNLIVDAGFRVAEVTTTNLSLPMPPSSWKKQPLLWLCWKYLVKVGFKSPEGILQKRLGVYTVIRAVRS